MKLIKSSNVEEYVRNNKKEAENEFPYIIKQLIKNTVENITGLDIPSGDNTVQTGFDGILKFNGTNKFLGDKPVNIEIGTDSNYIKKANKDIEKRTARKDENFVFITPYKWNNRKKSKTAWINEKKKKYKWNDIKIIDAEVLEDWLSEDIITSKYLLNKLNIEIKNIYNICEKEDEYSRKTKKAIKLDFFEYEDKEYENLLSELKQEYYNIIAPTREEGIYVTLYYLKKLGKEEKTLIIGDEPTWKEIINKRIVKNGILIPDFYHDESLEIPENNITLLIHDNAELTSNSDYVIKQRTINNLNRALELYYKDKNNQIDYDSISLIVKKSLGKYMPLKRELFKELKQPSWFNKNNAKLYLYLFFINKFKTSDMNLFEEFNVNVSELQQQLNVLITEKDPFIIYYKYWDQYVVVNIYDAIEWLGFSIDEDSIDKLCNIARKVLLYLEPRYLPENIDKTYYIEDTFSRIYSRNVKEGIIEGLIVTKLYLEKEKKFNLIRKIDKLMDEYYNFIKTEGQFLSFANIADKIVEINYEKYLKKIQDSIGNNEFEKMFDLTNKDTIFSANEYCNILWGIEKSIHKLDYIDNAVETLVLLSEMKNAEYKNMANTPFNTLKSVFLGWDNLTCLETDEKVKMLEKLIKKHNSQGKKLLQQILPNARCTWIPLKKPDFDTYDKIKEIKFVKEQKDFFEKYYMLYLINYVENIDDLICVYEEIYFIDFNCFGSIRNKTLELITKSTDEEKVKLKEKISEKIMGYKKFHNSAWSLTPKQLDYLTEIENAICYENPIYNYVCLYQYQYRILLDDKELERLRIKAMEVLKNNPDNEKILFEICENKRDLICDIYKYNHKNKCNINFLVKLFKDYPDYVGTYLRLMCINEKPEDLLRIFNSNILNQISIEDRILVISELGYNDFIYNSIKDTKTEKLYWKRLNIFNCEKDDFVYNECLKNENYEACLEIVYEQPDKYDEKCLLLEKIKESNTKPSQLDEYKIQKIFESFNNYEKIDSYEKIAKLEIYFGPILENKTYFLSKLASKSPCYVVELAELIYKDEDGKFLELPNRDIVVSNCLNILHDLRIDFNNNDSFAWCEEFLRLMREKKRTKIMFHILGQLLAKTGIDSEDKMYPSKSIRKVIEHYKSDDLASSFKIAKYNERGVHSIGIGQEEFTLSQKYLDWSKKMKIEYPETSKILKSLSETYKEEAIVIREEANYI